MWQDAINSYFKYVKNRIISVNSNRDIVAIIEANAWPPKNVQFNAFYLVILGETTPLGFGSATSRGLMHLVQWTWVISGDDLSQSQIGNNRGNRYAINNQMKQELRYGQFPNFCGKNTYVASQQGNQIVTTATPTGDNIWWSPPNWMPSKIEGEVGILYGAARVFINEFGDAINS